MQPTTITQGQQLYDPNTGKGIGTVQYDTQTGKPLATGATTQYNLPSPTVSPSTSASTIGTTAAYVPPVQTADNAYAELMAQQQSYQQESQRSYDAALAKDQSQETDVKNLQNQLLGQTADQQNFEAQQGLPGLNSQANDLQALAQMQTAKYLEGYTKLESSQTPLGLIQSGQNEISRQHGIDALITNANISAVSGKIATAQAQVDRAMSLKYDPIKQQLENSLQFLQRYDNQLSASDQKLSQAKQQQLELKLKQIDMQKANETAIQNIAIEAARNGAPANVLASIGKAASVDQATSLASGYFQDPLDVQLKKLQIAKAKSSLSGSGSSSVKIVKINGRDYVQNADGTFSNPKVPGSNATVSGNSPLSQLTSVIDTTGTKDNNNLQNITGVISAVEQLATNNQDGKFSGLGLIRPGKLTIGAEGTYNQSAIEAINLKVQQWASGAALTTAQTKQVEKITPKVSDTDKIVKQKIDSLSNFMLGQAQGILASQGISYSPSQADYFNSSPQGVATDYVNNIVLPTLAPKSTPYGQAGYLTE